MNQPKRNRITHEGRTIRTPTKLDFEKLSASITQSPLGEDYNASQVSHEIRTESKTHVSARRASVARQFDPYGLKCLTCSLVCSGRRCLRGYHYSQFNRKRWLLLRCCITHIRGSFLKCFVWVRLNDAWTNHSDEYNSQHNRHKNKRSYGSI